MSEYREKRAAEIQDSICEVLYHDWDPIGIAGYGPQDEYDSYIAPVYRILVGSKSEDELVDFLCCLSDEILGGAIEAEKFRKNMQLVARKLLQLDVKL